MRFLAQNLSRKVQLIHKSLRYLRYTFLRYAFSRYAFSCYVFSRYAFSCYAYLCYAFCIIPICSMPFHIMPICGMPFHIMPICITPFTTMPFCILTSCMIPEMGFYPSASVGCIPDLEHRISLLLFSFGLMHVQFGQFDINSWLLNFVIDRHPYLCLVVS